MLIISPSCLLSFSLLFICAAPSPYPPSAHPDTHPDLSFFFFFSSSSLFLFLLLLSSPLSPSHSLALLMILSVPQCHREKNFGSCKNIFVFLAQKLSSAFFFFFPPPRPVVARSYECFKPNSPKSVISLRFFHGINAIFTCGCARWWDLNICRINVSQEKKKPTKQKNNCRS